jgi:hypothetical protein
MYKNLTILLYLFPNTGDSTLQMSLHFHKFDLKFCFWAKFTNKAGQVRVSSLRVEPTNAVMLDEHIHHNSIVGFLNPCILIN